MIEPVPLQDVPRLEADPGLEVLTGIESRVVLLGFDHAPEELRLGEAGGTNPLRDVRVRRAIYQAIVPMLARIGIAVDIVAEPVSQYFGNCRNDRIDELAPLIREELDPAVRQALIDEVHEIMKEEVAYVPLPIQPLVRAVRKGVEVQQRPDNFFLLRWVRLDG